MKSEYADQRLLDTSEASEVLSISPRTLEFLRWRGGGPEFYKLGKRTVRYRLEDLMAWISKRQNTGGSPNA